MLPTSGFFGALGILVGKDFQISGEAVDAADRGGGVRGGGAKAEHHWKLRSTVQVSLY